MNPSLVSDAADPLGPQWFQAASQGLDAPGVALLGQAVEWVREPLRGAQASTGEPLAAHGAGLVLILQELGTDAITRAAALLAIQPVPVGEVTRADPLHKAFGPEITTLVQGVRALLRLGTVAGQVGSTSGADQKEMQRKMLLAMAADLRIVLMRLASRLQSLRWYAASHTPCPEAFAQETTTLYTPLANRLGIWQLKWEMEDLSFRFLQPETYKAIARQLEEKRAEREAFIDDIVERLRAALADAHIQAEISGRPKHIYSIWNKMRLKHLEFHQLFDLRALRVIVADERTCYAVLALVHAMWAPVPEEFDDYIARPKPNGYRSLHTVVADGQGRAFEIQIRTRDMHQYAEFGMAAHWRYKEAGARGGQVSASGDYDQKIAWMRQLLAWKEEGGPAPAAAPAGGGRIYVMTPQARVLELPEGSTPIDFAYLLHTDLGHRCRGAKVDGQMVPLSTPLKTGQTVEIVAAKSGGPSRDWLNPELGYLASPRARSKVRAWFNAVELQQRIAQGQALVEKELQRLGRTAVNQEHLAQELGFARADDLYVAAAKEEFSLRQIEHAFRQPEPAGPEPAGEARVYHPDVDSVAHTGKSGVLVVGVDSLLTQLARCCRPAPPDPIEGFVTRGRGVSIHRRDCPSWQALSRRHPERCIEVAWGETGDSTYPVDITIHAQDRPALLRDLSEVFARLRLRVVRVTTYSRQSLAHMVFTIEVRDGSQIRLALDAANELSGVRATRH
ncbi:MAG: bifunctional (p)ppGpp synthetase/guanosine-3',5'-bis(diphosphate) 3'-pyrophosphohydrolase [Castellaniella sp.]|uniref:RelA/SpoT family protein n=1 Tax=Castellaniella sp. TaxID=1955812 RepID=UPI0011FEC383|nr:bifunctional (p)ppGpp synthetase/guanosine-3',5'-bis(diphosphate) 3'-pyrophosphohydrolase [Castellaniella sp.]TAN30237.1 MAG: bifunctional (p)ppGpp synthetase/guanosine-3',5'-bis(diphosphate) 3'-pyrophosphohydrolase [Castellaniella sp.]